MCHNVFPPRQQYRALPQNLNLKHPVNHLQSTIDYVPLLRALMLDMSSIPPGLNLTPYCATRSQLPADHETAESAVRNLNGHDLGGRPLRIDLADSDPFLEGKTTVRGELLDGGETRAQWRERHDRERDRERNPNAFLQSLPTGVPIPPGSTALDTISTMLARADPSQILEVLAQMKVRVTILSPQYSH